MSGAWTLDVDADRVAWLTCDMPGSSTNVLSATVIQDLAVALTQAAAQKPAGLVVCSAKRSGFIAGADIKEFVDIRTPEEGYALVRAGQTVFDQLDALPFPSVAAIQGFALGGGLELALACSIRIGSARSSLGLPEVKLGLIPGAGGTQRLPRIVGRGRALDILSTGRQVPAEEAHAIGLLDRLVPEGRAEDVAIEIATSVASASGSALAALRRCVDVAFEEDLQSGIAFEASEENALFEHGDAREGIEAFVERRTPVFTGPPTAPPS